MTAVLMSRLYGIRGEQKGLWRLIPLQINAFFVQVISLTRFDFNFFLFGITSVEHLWVNWVLKKQAKLAFFSLG